MPRARVAVLAIAVAGVALLAAAAAASPASVSLSSADQRGFTLAQAQQGTYQVAWHVTASGPLAHCATTVSLENGAQGAAVQLFSVSPPSGEAAQPQSGSGTVDLGPGTWTILQEPNALSTGCPAYDWQVTLTPSNPAPPLLLGLGVLLVGGSLLLWVAGRRRGSEATQQR